MSENIEKSPNVPPFVQFVTSAVPMVFDNSMSYYEALCALWKFLQDDIIDVINNNAEVTEEYIQLTDQMKEYMDNYFENLDVQEEINHKLDELVADGTIPDILNDRLDYISQNLNNRISNFEINVGNEIAEINRKVNSIIGITPTVVASTDDMTDTSKLYVVTATNKWYYYANNQWNIGGDYNSDAGESLIKWYLENIATSDGNLFNPLTCKDNISIASASGEESANSTYWVSDYIEVTPYLAESQNLYYVGNIINLKTLLPCIYKFVAFDEDKQSLGQGTMFLNEYCTVSESIAEDVKYIRFQFAHTTIPYEDRDKLIFSTSIVPDRKNKTYYNVHETSIKDCGTSIFKDDISKNFCSKLIGDGIFPFTINDLTNGTIASATGLYRFDNTRILIDKMVLYKAGTRITLDNGWTMLSLRYAKNGNFLGNYVSGWSDSLTINDDVYLKLIFQNNNATVTGNTSFNSLLDSINLSTFENPNTYYGERIMVDNSYSTSTTNIVGLHQDGASYENTIVFCNQDGKYKVYDVNGSVLHNESYIDEYTQFIPHFNSVCFGTEKFAEGDNYPMFYGNAYNNTALPKGALYAYRLKNDYATEYKQRIVVGFTEDEIWAGDGNNVRPYGNFVIDTDNNYLYAFTMIDSLQVTRFFKFEMPTIADGNDVTLDQSDILEYFDVPYETYIQGCCYKNGKIYSLSGFGTNEAPAQMHVIDLVSKTEVSLLPLGNIEPEAVFIADKYMYIGQTTMKQYSFK